MKPTFCLLAIFALTLSIGCGGGKPEAKLVEAEVIVQIDGKPADGIQVTMMPDISANNKGPASMGTSDKAGKVIFHTMKGNKKGLVPGAHKATAFDTKEDRPPQGQPQKNPSRIAGAYATEKGGLVVKVEEGKKLILNFKSK